MKGKIGSKGDLIPHGDNIYRCFWRQKRLYNFKEDFHTLAIPWQKVDADTGENMKRLCTLAPIANIALLI